MADKGLKVRILGIEEIDEGKKGGETIYAEVSLRKERFLFVFFGGDRSLLGRQRRERRKNRSEAGGEGGADHPPRLDGNKKEMGGGREGSRGAGIRDRHRPGRSEDHPKS